MNLRPAIALHDYEEDQVSGFGDRQRRQERRAARRERRQQRRQGRRELKSERRLERVQRKRQRVQDRLVPAVPRAATLQPAPMAMQPQRKPGRLVDRAMEWVDDFVDDGEDEPFDEEESEDATAGLGAVDTWGPSVRMGRRLRIQAALGHRAAVIQLKPGLFLVADLPAAVTRTEFGLAPLLAPMMMRAAQRSLDEPRPERRGPFARLFRRRQREEPVRYVQVVQPPMADPALPGPSDGAMLVAAPNVAWADDATVAAAYGCDTCDRRTR